MILLERLNKREALFLLKDFTVLLQRQALTPPTTYDKKTVIDCLKTGNVPKQHLALLQYVVYVYLLKSYLPNFTMKDLITVLFKKMFPQERFKTSKSSCFTLFVAVQDADVKLELQSIQKHKTELKFIIDKFNMEFKEALSKRGLDYLQ